MPTKARVLTSASKTRTVQRERASPQARGYTNEWRKAARLYLQMHPLCECPECLGKRLLVASVVDHRIPHRGNSALFWDPSNWQAMHKRCHDAKTAREDGGFGNRKMTG